MIITIDGPAGSGKSTTAKAVAEKLGAVYLDTGAMYRAVTLKALEGKVNPDDRSGLEAIARNISIAFEEGDKGQRTILDGIDRTEDIRMPLVERSVSAIAACLPVRERMVALQREIAGAVPKVVLEGRDTGSVVFPDADFKFYLTAGQEARAARRAKQMGRETSDINDVMKDIALRDAMDSSRKASPLTIPPGAVEIDNTELTVDETVEKILGFLS